ncbi:LysR family transcriptional regulator ArgP [Nocardioides houyundeii]|uniref:LysR family transcriptional regulator ArgP n=1 Tax=Nocardioides houyundeii TaxID=2045452 RepID=UPI001F07A974|nr:LysR family transcriptional regulator ArgP [Nocardioides houyundeii]
MKDLTQLDPVALRTLATAVGLGTFEAAARELHVTPSAVSQRIKALETRVGRVLVHRVKPLEASEAGQVLVRLAAQQELLEREAVAQLLEDEDAEEGTPYAAVPLAVNSDALYTWLIDALVAVQVEHRVTFELLRADQSRTAEHLRRGDVMAALTSDPRPVPGCRVVQLGRMRYQAVATPEWQRTHLPDGSPPAALARAPMIAFDHNDTLQHDFLRKVTRRRLAPPATFIPSVAQFENAVRRGMGWGMLLELQAADALEQGSLVELVPGRHVDVPLYWQHWRLESQVVADLTREVTAAARAWLG